MPRFFIGVLVVYLGFTVFIGLAVLLGRQQSFPARFDILHLTDCAPPCWLGIMPGVTTLDEAIPLANAHYANLPDYETIFSVYPSTLSIQVVSRENPDDAFAISLYAEDDRRVSVIVFGIHVNQRSITVAELSNLVGMPGGIAVNRGRAVTAYTLSFGTYNCFGATMLPDKLNHTSFIQHPNSLHFCEGQDKDPTWRVWRGFRSVEAYSR